MKKLALAATALSSAFWLGSQPAQAEPTYLECTMLRVKDAGESPSEPLKAEVTLNESEQSASFYLPKTGLTKRVGATFQQTVITFNSVIPSATGIGTTDSWSIDRTDGSLTRTMDSSMRGVALLNVRWEGSCKKKPPVQRAF